MVKLKERAKRICADIPAVYLSFKDKDTPVIAKITAAVTVAYALSPIDLIPDFIPVLGYLDDVIILPALIMLTIRLIPEEIWDRNRKAAAAIWRDGKPKKWYCAIPVIAVWLLIVWMAVKAVLL